MISGTITDLSGRTLSGQTAEAFYYSLRHARPLSIGLNCALGATELRAYVDALAQVADCYVSAHPNAGLPNAFGEYDETPEQMAAMIGEFAREWPGQLRRRLLRHDARAYPRDRRGGARRDTARTADHRIPSRLACHSREGGNRRHKEKQRKIMTEYARYTACPASNRWSSRRSCCSSTSASAPTSPARRSSRS